MDRHTFQRLLFTHLADAHAWLPPADPLVFDNNRRAAEFEARCALSNADVSQFCEY